MNVEYHKWWSHNLNRDMEYKVYGHDWPSWRQMLPYFMEKLLCWQV